MNALSIAAQTVIEPPPTIAVEVPKGFEQNICCPFNLSCNLAEHPLFQIQRLVQLGDFIAAQNPNQVTHVVTGKKPTDGKLVQHTQPSRMESVAQAKKTGLLLLIHGAQKDPEYQALLEKIVNALEKTTEQLLRQQNVGLDAYIFVRSIDLVTEQPIHKGSNFLFRMHEKKIDRYSSNNHSICVSLIYSPDQDYVVDLNLFTIAAAKSSHQLIRNLTDYVSRNSFREMSHNSSQTGTKLGYGL
jgi:hypothetical protein